MRPGPRLLTCLTALALTALFVGLSQFWLEETHYQVLALVWWLAFALIVLVATLDALLSREQKRISVSRETPAGLALGQTHTISLTLQNNNAHRVQLALCDLLPPELKSEQPPQRFHVEAHQSVRLDYRVTPVRRGNAFIAGSETVSLSRLGLWQKKKHHQQGEHIKVFPNFTAISHFELLVRGQHVNQLGIHLLQRRGEGLEFHQLREFRPGDALRQVDWKATSRQLKPISREFQDERDQDIVFLIDCGRRMRAKEDDISHFDHALNAILAHFLYRFAPRGCRWLYELCRRRTLG